MRPHPQSKKRQRRDRERQPGQYPRIALGVFRRGQPMDLTRFTRNPVLLLNHEWDHQPIGIVRNLRCDRRGVWTFLPFFLPQYKEQTTAARVAKTVFRMGLMEAGIGGENDRRTGIFRLFEISLIKKPSYATTSRK